jgi:hypothetical protein
LVSSVDQVGPIHVVQRGDLAEHDLAVLELQGVGVTGVGDGDDLGPAGHLLEDRVQHGVAQAADVRHADAEAGQGVGHDGAVAAELHLAGDQLVVAALAGGGGDLLGQEGDGLDGLEGVEGVPLVDHGDDLVDEPVEPDQRLDLPQASRGGRQLAGRRSRHLFPCRCHGRHATRQVSVAPQAAAPRRRPQNRHRFANIKIQQKPLEPTRM